MSAEVGSVVQILGRCPTHANSFAPARPRSMESDAADDDEDAPTHPSQPMNLNGGCMWLVDTCTLGAGTNFCLNKVICLRGGRTGNLTAGGIQFPAYCNCVAHRGSILEL